MAFKALFVVNCIDADTKNIVVTKGKELTHLYPFGRKTSYFKAGNLRFGLYFQGFNF